MVLQDVIQLSSFHVSYTMPKTVTGILSLVRSKANSEYPSLNFSRLSLQCMPLAYNPVSNKQLVIGSDDIPGGEVGLDMEL